jgi:glyoxylase-like metal-dependent hydrolase (beta-lactamase superfamily II)
MEKISDHIWVETELFGANIGIIKTDTGVVLIDTPMNPTDQDVLTESIKEKGLGPITWIIATDHHMDHFMGASLLPGNVISHEAVRGKFMEAFGPLEKIVDRVTWSDPKGVDRIKTLKIKEPMITFDKTLSLFLEPVSLHLKSFIGHTTHTLAVRVEPDDVLFAGDNIVNGIPPFFHEAELPLGWVQSLKDMKELSFSTVVPGHGEVTDRSVVDDMMKQVEAVIDAVKAALNRGLSKEEIQEQVRYLTSFFDVQDITPQQKAFYRELEKRGIAWIVNALK